MMKILERIQRNPTLLIAFVAAVLAALSGLGVLTERGVTLALGVVAAAIACLWYVVSPAREVTAQTLPDGTIVVDPAYQLVPVAGGPPVAAADARLGAARRRRARRRQRRAAVRARNEAGVV